MPNPIVALYEIVRLHPTGMETTFTVTTSPTELFTAPPLHASVMVTVPSVKPLTKLSWKITS